MCGLLQILRKLLQLRLHLPLALVELLLVYKILLLLMELLLVARSGNLLDLRLRLGSGSQQQLRLRLGRWTLRQPVHCNQALMLKRTPHTICHFGAAARTPII